MEKTGSQKVIIMTKERGPTVAGTSLLLAGAWMATPLGIICMVIGTITLGVSLWLHCSSLKGSD